MPLHFATLPNGQIGRLRSTLPSVTWTPRIESGARPVATHDSIASILLNPAGARATGAMIHARHHVELNLRAHEPLARSVDDLREEVDRVAIGHLGIGEAVIEEELPAALEERREVW
jgi:hypothetical protein